MTSNPQSTLFPFALCLLSLLSIGRQVQAQEEKSGEKAKILFYGLHDREFPAMAKCVRETGIPVDRMTGVSSSTPVRVREEMEQKKKIDFSQYDVIYILQVNAVEASLLADSFKGAKRKNPKLRVLQLDHRDSQQELRDEGVMEIDPNVEGYWKTFAVENLKRLLVYTNIRYLGANGEIPVAIPVPKNGFYHPDASSYFEKWPEYLEWYETTRRWTKDAPFVSIVVQQDYTVFGDSAAYDAVIREFEKNRINVAPIFGGQKDLQALLRDCRPSVLMLQHHGGPEDVPEPGKESFLEELDIPYIFSSSLVGGMSIKQWRADVKGTARGVGQLHRHEYHGIIEPIIVGAREPTGLGYALNQPIPERIQRLVGRVKSWLNLRSKPVSQKKIAIVYFHKYLGKAAIGLPSAGEMARYFDVHPSLVNVLRAMKEHGYRIDELPESGEEVVEWMKKRGRNVATWAPGSLQELVREGDPVLIPEEEYLAWFEQKLSTENRRRVIEKHGPPPGKFMVTTKRGKSYVVIPVIRLGNVVMAPQPNIGDIQDTRLVQSRKVPPPHNYLAFYWWLQDKFKADAVVHFGAFGSDLMLPGKEVFLSNECFPDIIMKNMPNVYVWSTACIGIGIIAKRRSYAVLVNHTVPPVLTAGLSLELIGLQDKIYQYDQVKGGMIRDEYRKTISEEAKKAKLHQELRLPLDDDGLLSDSQIVRVFEYIERVQEDNVPNKMHVLGTVPPDDETIPFLAHVIKSNTDFFEKLADAEVIDKKLAGVVRSPRIHELLRTLVIEDSSAADFARSIGKDEGFVLENLSTELAFAKSTWRNMQNADQEITNLLAALNGRFISPGPGGTPIQRPEVLPTGRNMYGLSPDVIPTREAWNVGRVLLDQYLKQFKQKKNTYPRRVAFQMTGMDTFLDMGVMEAQILYLIGVRPKWSPSGTIKAFEVIGAEELKRPRIDPFISIGSIYLKDFPSRVQILDEAIRMANEVNEEDNYLRSNSLDIETYMLSLGTEKQRAKDLSVARIFGSPPGESSVKLIWYIPRSGTWNTRKDLLDVRRTLRTHVYTQDLWGENILQLHDRVIQKRDVVFSNWSNNLYGPLTNHHYPEETGGLALEIEMTGGTKPEIVIQDLRKRKLPRFMLLEDVLNMEARSTFFNKEWIQGQMEHGYLGATQFMGLADHVFQWESVREGAVWPETWRKMAEVYVRDSYDLTIREWFDKHNPHAFQEFVATMLEGTRKEYWSPSPELMKEMVQAYAKSVAEFGYSESAYTGGNERLQRLVRRNLDAPGDQELLEKYNAEVAKVEAPAPLPEEVSGKELESQNDAGEKTTAAVDRFPFVWVVILGSVVVFLLGFFLRRKGTPPRATSGSAA